MPKLTEKQKLFVKEYLVDLNATQAAIRAGYSEDTARQIGAENLTKPYIQEAIQEEMKKREERTEITADKVLQQLYKQAFADIRDFIEWKDVHRVKGYDPDTNEPIIEVERVIKLKDMNEVDGTLITEIQETKDGIRFKRADNQKALELLGRHLRLFTDKVEHSGEISVKKLEDFMS